MQLSATELEINKELQLKCIASHDGESYKFFLHRKGAKTSYVDITSNSSEHILYYTVEEDTIGKFSCTVDYTRQGHFTSNEEVFYRKGKNLLL